MKNFFLVMFLSSSCHATVTCTIEGWDNAAGQVPPDLIAPNGDGYVTSKDPETGLLLAWNQTKNILEMFAPGTTPQNAPPASIMMNWNAPVSFFKRDTKAPGGFMASILGPIMGNVRIKCSGSPAFDTANAAASVLDAKQKALDLQK